MRAAMDNIAKLVLGTVSLIGMVVLMIPEGDPLIKSPTAVAAAPSGAVPPQPAQTATSIAPQPASETPPPQPNLSQSDDQIAFGQPMFDPTPPGERARQSEGAAVQQPNSETGGAVSGFTAPPSFAVPSPSYSPPPFATGVLPSPPSQQ
jgi:hypothetical protein